MPKPAAIYTYPWDIADEGLEPAIRRLTETAGQNEVLLATSYHISTYFLPHNPKRKLYYGEDGMVLYQPDLKRYEKLKIKPKVSELVTGPEYYPEIVKAIRDAKLRYGVWMVYAYNHHLARKHPDCARQDALGNRYLAQLCVGNPDVREYFRVLTREVLERFQPETAHVESLEYLAFSYGFMNPKVFMEISARDQFLLGVCFCKDCVAAAGKSGMDGERFRDAVAAHLRRSLPVHPQGEDALPATREWMNQVFDGRLAHYLAARVETATSLYEEITAMYRAARCETTDFWSGPESEPRSGIDTTRKVKACDRFCIGSSQLGQGLKEIRKLSGKKKILLSLEPPDTNADLGAKLRAFTREVDGFTFYNYGLLRDENLANIGAAREAWA